MAGSSEKISVVSKREMGMGQASIECRLTLPEQKCRKILCSTPKVEVTACEVLLREANVSGKAMINVVYLTDNEEVAEFSNTFVFSCKINSDMFEPGQCIVVLPKIEDFQTQSVDEDEIKYNLTVCCTALGYPQREMDISSGMEDCCIKFSPCQASKLIKSYNLKLSDTLSFEFKDKIKKVLQVDIQTIQKDVECQNAYIKLVGEDVVDVMYLEDDIEPKIKRATFTQPFSQELELGGITKDTVVDCFINAKNEATTSSLEMLEEGCEVRVNREAAVDVVALENYEFDSIEDVYSLTHTTLVSTNSYEYFTPTRKLFFQNKIDGSLVAPIDSPRIDKVLQNTSNQIRVVSSYLIEDEVVVQGIVISTLIYLNDETSSIQSIEVEVPFEVSQRIGEEKADENKIDVNCVVANVDVVAKRGKDIFVEAEVKTYVQMYKASTGAAITNIELQEELPPKSGAMEIYFASAGQTLWDIGKDMIEDVQTLAQFNSDLPDVMTGTEKIICYRKRSLDF